MFGLFHCVLVDIISWIALLCKQKEVSQPQLYVYTCMLIFMSLFSLFMRFKTEQYRKVSLFAQDLLRITARIWQKPWLCLTLQCVFLANLLLLVSLAEPDISIDRLRAFLSWHSYTPSSGHSAVSSISPF